MSSLKHQSFCKVGSTKPRFCYKNTTITPLDNSNLSVNGKELYVNMDGKWATSHILSEDEKTDLHYYILKNQTE